SEPAHRAHHAVEPPISEHAATGDALLRLARLLAGGRAGAGHRLDRAAGAKPIRLFILRGRVLGADAALTRCRSAGDEPSEGQARRGSGAGGALRLRSRPQAWGPFTAGEAPWCNQSASYSQANANKN